MGEYAYVGLAPAVTPDTVPTGWDIDWTFPGPPWPPGWPIDQPANLTLPVTAQVSTGVGGATSLVVRVLQSLANTSVLNLHSLVITAAIGSTAVTLKKAAGDSYSSSITYQITNYSGAIYGLSTNIYLNLAAPNIGSNVTITATVTSVTANLVGTGTTAVTAVNHGALAFSAATYSVSETDGTVTVTVTRTGGTDGAVTVAYATSDGTATAGSDYTAASGTLSWADGESTSKTFAVTVFDDSNVEGSETFTATLSGATGGATLGVSSTTVTITNVAHGMLAFSAATYSVNENAGTVTISVTRTSGSTGAVGVSYSTVAVTATPGVDYTETSGVLSWADADAATKTFTVPILDDDDVGESNKTFAVLLTAPTGNASLGVDTSVVTIINIDHGTLVFSAASYAVAETDVTVTITIKRTGGSVGAVGVNYGTTDDTAIAGTDYTTTTGTKTWTDGDAADKTFTVAINANTDGLNQFKVFLNTATGYAAIGTPNESTVILAERDAMKVVKAASTANLTLSGEQTIDGISCVAGEKVLAKNQTTAADRGVYTVSAGAWTGFTQAEAVAVKQGTVSARLIYILTSANTYTAELSVYG